MPKLNSMPNRQHRHQQHGAVLIVFGLSIAVLIGFLALVIDLGRTYVIRTELQNAADAAALAGAKELNQSLAGVTSAVAKAKAIALQNNFKFSTPVNLDTLNATISVGSCPDDGSCTMVLASTVTTDALAAGKTFLKIAIQSGGLATFFGGFVGSTSTSTYGNAVAGYFVLDITPIGVCAIDLFKGGIRPSLAGNELTEYGFRRGIAYDLMLLGDVAGSSTPYLLNPVDVFGVTCSNSNSSASAAVPYLCSGSSTVAVKVPGSVYGSTGFQASSDKALNSRFDNYQGNTCDPSVAPPDINVKDYTIVGGGATGLIGNPRDWTDPGFNNYPSQQSISIDPATHKPFPNPTIDQYGALWSYSRAVKAVGTSPNATAATGAAANFSLTDWPTLYAGNKADVFGTVPRLGYPNTIPPNPPFPTGTLSAPYSTTAGTWNGNYFSAPSHTGKRDRRVLQVAIVNCPTSSGNNCGATINILSVGRFFMTTKSNVPTSLVAEFDGLVDPIPPTEIRLYK